MPTDVIMVFSKSNPRVANITLHDCIPFYTEIVKPSQGTQRGPESEKEELYDDVSDHTGT